METKPGQEVPEDGLNDIAVEWSTEIKTGRELVGRETVSLDEFYG